MPQTFPGRLPEASPASNRLTGNDGLARWQAQE